MCHSDQIDGRVSPTCESPPLSLGMLRVTPILLHKLGVFQ